MDLSRSWKSTNDSFIFSFINRTNLQSAKVGYKMNSNRFLYFVIQIMDQHLVIYIVEIVMLGKVIIHATIIKLIQYHQNLM